MAKKLNNQRGETLIETLVSLLIISLGMVLLAGSIAVAARVNRNAENQANLVDQDATWASSAVTVQVDDTGTYSATLHTEEGGLSYYVVP